MVLLEELPFRSRLVLTNLSTRLGGARLLTTADDAAAFGLGDLRIVRDLDARASRLGIRMG